MSKTTKDRTAIYAIRGYFYQFDFSILEILNADSNHSVTIEGIEDIDIESSDERIAIQCKYYETKDYNPSEIKKAIQNMVEHFSKHKGEKLAYRIYAHFKNNPTSPILPADVCSLKAKFLTIRHRTGETTELHENLKLGDEDLALFLTKLKVDISAISLEKQKENVIQAIKQQFSNSTDNEAEFYYSNALKEVRLLAIQKDVKERTITKEEFISRVDNKEALFDEWYLAQLNEEKYFKVMKSRYFPSVLNISPSVRLFLLDIGESTSIDKVKTIIIEIVNKYCNIKEQQPTPFSPYIYLHNISEDKLADIKNVVWNDGFKFVDGYGFKGANFDLDTLAMQSSFSNQIRLKFINELTEIENLLNREEKKRKHIFQFYQTAPFYENDEHENNKIRINKVTDIKKIIVGGS
ncbi:MAG: hypothetical protein FWG67_00335 [Defluviitaleaceae bacterium]|nr:hypothetical protein [Defluviitaleaceae bacterium]